MKRRSRWERSPGWIRSSIGTAVLVGGWFALLTFTVGPVLAWASDLIGGAR